VIKVLDMGLARFFNKQQDSVTEKYDERCVLGTADYLAPEQAVSNLVDIRADIYALGGTFYFMLTGQTPFPDGTITAKLVAHQTREPRSVDTFRADAPAGMLAVLRKMMAKEPADRYQTPIEVAEALAEWADVPVTPPPPREMPLHCPLVQGLAGPTSPMSGAPLARVLFGPGRAVFSRSASSTALGSPSAVKAGSSSSPSTVSFGTSPGSNPSYPLGEEVTGPVSTARSSATPTTPIPPRPEHLTGSHRSATGGQIDDPQQNRTTLYIIIAILLGLLFAVGAIAAYYVGRADAGRAGPELPSHRDRDQTVVGVTTSEWFG
jgi:serine/threonine protein kinase